MPILKGKSGDEAELWFALIDDDGNPITGYSFEAASLKFCPVGGTFDNLTAPQVAAIVEKGVGAYALQLTADETADGGTVGLQIWIGAAQAYQQVLWTDILDVAVTSLAADSIAADSFTDAAKEAIGQAVWDLEAVNGHSHGDMVRLFLAVMAGPVTDFETGNLLFLCPETGKLRLTVTCDANGRHSPILGDLTP